MQGLRKRLEVARAKAKQNVEKSQNTSKEYYDKQTAQPELKIGDRVYVYTPRSRKGLSKKLLYAYHRQMTIIQKTSPVNFQVFTDKLNAKL